MALILPDRVKVRSTSSGTGTFTLTTVVEGFRSFAAVGDGNETYYGIVDYAGRWEIGRGTWTSSGNTLSRDTVISSSNNNAKVNFPAGGKTVYATFPSSLAQSIFSSTSTDSFSNIVVAGQDDLNADSSTDTLTIVAGTGITLTTNASTDTLTITGAAADLGDLGISSGTIYNSASYDQSIWIAPGGESTSYIQIPGNAESDYTQLTIANQSTTGGVRIVANSNQISLEPTGRIQQNTSLTYTDAGSFTRTTPTVIWSSSFEYVSSAKLVIQIEGEEVGDATNLHSQACEAIIASRGYGNGVYGYGDPAMTVYGVVHTSVDPLVTFTVQRNATTRLIEVLATSTAAADGSTVYYSVHSVEMLTWD